MKKGLLILSFILFSVISFAQRQRTTAVFDSDTTTRPKAGFYGIGIRGNKVYFVPPSGTTFRILNANTHVGTNGQFLFTNGSVNYFSNIVISNVTNLQSSLDAKFNTPSGLTTNFLTKWTGSMFGNSLVFDNGTNLGISTASPEHKLHINGGLYASGLTAPQTATTSGYSIGATGGLPYSYMKITSAAVDTKIWDHYTDGANLYYRILNDANSIGTTYMRINRTTTTINGIYFPNGNVGIGTTSPDASALFHVSSTTKGVLITRGTTTQINAISTPANGLMVYNTTLNKLCVYENGTWKQVTTTNM